jgi:hypothetical protein
MKVNDTWNGIGILPAKAVLCGYNPYLLIHTAKNVENQKPLAITFSKTRNDEQFLIMISRINKWYLK